MVVLGVSQLSLPCLYLMASVRNVYICAKNLLNLAAKLA